jgi:hypothetical protein
MTEEMTAFHRFLHTPMTASAIIVLIASLVFSYGNPNILCPAQYLNFF